jgi:hypothetical protein
MSCQRRPCLWRGPNLTSGCHICKPIPTPDHPAPIQNAIEAVVSHSTQLIHAHHYTLEAMVRAARQSQAHVASSNRVLLFGNQGLNSCTYLWQLIEKVSGIESLRLWVGGRKTHM